MEYSTLFFLKIFSLGAIFSPKQTFGDMQPFLFGCQMVCPLKNLLIHIASSKALKNPSKFFCS
jgi:hypothetical protein